MEHKKSYSGSGKSLLKTSDVGFMFCCQSGQMDFVKKLIFDDRIEYSETIKAVIKSNPTEYYLEAEKMFEQREMPKKLSKELSESLQSKDVIEKKVKV